MNRLRLIAIVTLGMGCAHQQIAPYTPKKRVYQPASMMNSQAPTSSPGSLWRNGGPASMLFTDARALREGDLVVVKIEEVADAQRSAATDTAHSSDVSAQLAAFIQSVKKTDTAGPGVGLNATVGNDFKGEGTTGRSERLTATVPAVVRQVLGNGNLFIEGHRVVLVNSEEHHFYISGVVRPIDIDQDNSIKSAMIADAEIEFTGQGVLTDNQQKGFFARYLGWLWPF